MRIDTETEMNQRSRRIMNFDSLGIDYFIRLGEVHNNSSQPPLLEHFHKDSFEAVIFQSGFQKYSIGDKLYSVQSSEMFLSLPNELHSSAQYYEEKSHFFYFIFSLPSETPLPGFTMQEIDFAKSLLYSMQDRVFPVQRSIFGVMKNILDTYFLDAPFRIARIQSYTNELLCSILAAISNTESKRTISNPILENMKDYIDSNISRMVHTSELAHYVHLSESRVNQIFQENGLTLHDYILRKKIEIAKEMLFFTDLSITEIAFQLDFTTSQHFATVFTRYAHHSPSEYRKKRRAHQISD